MDSEIIELIKQYARENYVTVNQVYNYVEPLVEGKDKPVAYVKTVLKNLDPRQFYVSEDIAKMIIELLNMFKEKEISGEIVDKLMIEEIEIQCLLEFPITVEEMRTTNNSILEYMFSKCEISYSNFLNYLLKSKVLRKCNPAIAVIKTQCERTAKALRIFSD